MSNISDQKNKTTKSDVDETNSSSSLVEVVVNKRKEDEEEGSSGREKLKRHRVEVAGRVWVPDMWGQENYLKDWADCATFDASLVNSKIVLARDSLMQEAAGRRRRANSSRLRIPNIYGC